MENNVKHIAPNPTMTWAGTKYAMLTNSASDKYADKNKQGHNSTFFFMLFFIFQG